MILFCLANQPFHVLSNLNLARKQPFCHFQTIPHVPQTTIAQSLLVRIKLTKIWLVCRYLSQKRGHHVPSHSCRIPRGPGEKGYRRSRARFAIFTPRLLHFTDDYNLLQSREEDSLRGGENCLVSFSGENWISQIPTGRSRGSQIQFLSHN